MTFWVEHSQNMIAVDDSIGTLPCGHLNNINFL